MMTGEDVDTSTVRARSVNRNPRRNDHNTWSMPEGRPMRTASWLKFLCLVAALCCGLVAAARAVDSTPPSDPPAMPDNPLPGTPAPASPQPATAQPTAADPAKDIQACLQETGDYVTHGNAVTYVIGLTNSCDKRLRCEIFANISSARGTATGHTIMTLGRASDRSAAKKTYEMPVKTAGGIAQVSRECRVL
jgi:hypothetical protein